MESVVGGLASALARRGHDVEVITLQRAITDGGVLPEGTWGGVQYRRLRRLGPRRYPMGCGLFGAVRGADLVHVHGLDGLADQLVRSGHIVGISTHGGFFHTSHTPFKKLWLRLVTRRTLRRANAVWFTSAADRDLLYRCCRIEGSVVANGVDVDFYSAVARRPQAGRWLVPGRIDAHKGIEDLILVLAKLKRPDVHVHLVGPDRVPHLRDKLMKLAHRLGVVGQITIRGPVQDLRSEFARCELALFPSRYEGFGVCVVEAMAARVPCVVSSIQAFDALVTDGVDAIQVDFRDVECAAARLAQPMNLEQLVRGGQRTSARYSWSKVVLEWERQYTRLVGSTP
ncbi:MAG: glycosyltransferase family 4 protein [Proteobacteria bacterium]|nr:glycosyltransferase family 4 protein [Pseudomonadota bacterium]